MIARLLEKPGGGERQAIMLGKELMRRGHEVVFYTTAYDPSQCFPEDIQGLTVKVISREPVSASRWWRLPILRSFAHSYFENRLARRVASAIDERTDMLQPYDHWGSHVAVFFKRAHPNTVSIFMLNDLDIARWSLFDDPQLSGKKAWIKYPFYAFKDFLEQVRYFGEQDAIAVLNDRTALLVKKYMKRSAVVVRSGLDLEKFSYRVRAPLSKETSVRILTHGIFYIHRRFEDIINAVSVLRARGYHKLSLDIVGAWDHKSSGKAYHERLVELVQRLGLESVVTFRGEVSDEELKNAYHDADLFVSAAHMQTWGLAVFEAMASGLPVLISKTIGAAEVLRDRETALFMEACDSGDVARAIAEVIDHPSLYKKLSQEGNKFVRKEISWKRYADRMLAIFKEVSVKNGRN